MEIEKHELWCPHGHLNASQALFISELVSAKRPRACLETGFCTGRSALSVLLSHAVERFVTIDIDFDYADMGGDGSNGRRYKKLLEESFPAFKAIEGASMDILTKSFFESEFPSGIDWFTVDGDHSYEGCYWDILTAIPLMNEGGTILIDDYKSGPPDGWTIPEVTLACDTISKELNLEKEEWHSKGKGICIFHF